MKTCVVLMFLIATCISSSSAIQCYDCVYPTDPECGDPINDSQLQGETCSEPNAAEKLLKIKAVCYKNVFTFDGVNQVTRSCTKQVGNNSPCKFAGEIMEHCSVCETDFCNSSSNLLISFWTMMMPIAIALFMKSY